MESSSEPLGTAPTERIRHLRIADDPALQVGTDPYAVIAVLRYRNSLASTKNTVGAIYLTNSATASAYEGVGLFANDVVGPPRTVPHRLTRSSFTTQLGFYSDTFARTPQVGFNDNRVHVVVARRIDSMLSIAVDENANVGAVAVNPFAVSAAGWDTFIGANPSGAEQALDGEIFELEWPVTGKEARDVDSLVACLATAYAIPAIPTRCETCTRLREFPGALATGKARRDAFVLAPGGLRAAFLIPPSPLLPRTPAHERSAMADPTQLDLSVIVPLLQRGAEHPRARRSVCCRRSRRASSAGELSWSTTARRDGTARVIREHDEDASRGDRGVFHPREPGARRRRGGPGSTRRARRRSRCSTPTCSTSPRTCCGCSATLERPQHRRRAGLAQPVGREKRPRYYISRGFNALLNTAFGMHLHDNKSGFVCCAEEVIAGPPDVPGQLLLLAVVHHGGRPRQGLLVQARSRRCSRTARAGHVVPRQRGAARRRRAASSTSARRAWEYRLRRRSATIARASSSSAAPASSHRPAARAPGAAAALARLHGVVRAHALDDHARRRALLRDAATSRSGCRPAQMRELQDEKLRRLVRHAYRNVPYYRERMQELEASRPRTSAARTTCTSCRCLTKADVRKHLYFDIMQREPRQGGGAQDHHLRLDRRAVRLLRRPRAARVPLGGHAALAGVDRLPLRRPDGAAVAPDDRHVASRRSRKERARRGARRTARSSRSSRCRDDKLEEMVAPIEE